MTSETTTMTLEYPCLSVCYGGETSTTKHVESDESFFVGSAESCAIVLEGKRVSPFHCMFTLTDQRLTVLNCETGESTLVNGNAIEKEHQLEHGDRVEIGDNVITWLLHANSEDSSGIAGDSALSSQMFDQQELELLRFEVEDLQQQLLDREREIEDLKSGDSGNEHSDGSETERLVVRLEELLEELESSDQKVSALQELLRAADDANLAEQEERIQLERCLAEVESRVSEREDELKGEIDALQAKLNESKSQLELAIDKLQQVGSDPDGVTITQELYEKTQQHFQTMAARITGLETENERLKEHMKNSDEAALLEENQQLKSRVAQCEIELSTGRAEYARQRADLEKIRNELDVRASQGPTDSDTKLRAMRQHLRELHAEEVAMRNEKKQQSLGGRIAKLLNRV